ncbi:MAG: hypothetical protein JXR65_11360 [Bacteroidales bacterium]|nr:hypothetical protein [Bacteroidales bacterium]
MLKQLRFIFFLFVLIGTLLPATGTAQEMAGLSFSNYSGISGVRANPAFLTGSKVYLDVNILGAGTFFDNNFAYIPNNNANFWTLVNGDSLPAVYGKYNYNNFYTYYTNRPYNDIATVVNVMGPSAMLQMGTQAFGISFSARSYNSSWHTPNSILQTIYNGKPDSSLVNLEQQFSNLNFSSLSWMELGFHYAYDFYNRYGNKFTAGASLKYLYGVEGGYISIQNFKYHWQDSKTIHIDSVDAAIGFSLPVDYYNSSANLHPLSKGHGIGLDLGFVYTRNKTNVSPTGEKALCAKPYEDYRYRIGFSIMDIGRIRFRNNAQLHEYQVGDVDFNSEISANGINNLFRSIDAQLYNGDSLGSLKDSIITLSLPTAMSLQFDYHYNKNFYLSGLWIHPLRFQNKSLRRPAELLVMPRYDTRKFGVSLPVSWYDYQKLRLGLALRIYTVTIGTEKLGTLLGVGDLTGVDFYFNIKFNLLKGSCVSWKKGACFSSGKQ